MFSRSLFGLWTVIFASIQWKLAGWMGPHLPDIRTSLILLWQKIVKVIFASRETFHFALSVIIGCFRMLRVFIHNNKLMQFIVFRIPGHTGFLPPQVFSLSKDFQHSNNTGTTHIDCLRWYECQSRPRTNQPTPLIKYHNRHCVKSHNTRALWGQPNTRQTSAPHELN